MEKKIAALFFILTFVLMSSALHARSPEGARRGPSVEPIVEIDIEREKNPTAEVEGFNFAQPSSEQTTKRIPANITANEQNADPIKFLFPFALVILLPIAVWFLISKKFTQEKEATVVDIDSYGNIKVLETKSDESGHDDDNNHLPKAS